MQSRRRFLRSLVTGAGALLVGDAALAALRGPRPLVGDYRILSTGMHENYLHRYAQGFDEGQSGGDYSARVVFERSVDGRSWLVEHETTIPMQLRKVHGPVHDYT